MFFLFRALEHLYFQFGVCRLFLGWIFIYTLLVFPPTFCESVGFQKLIFPLTCTFRIMFCELSQSI